MEGKDSLGQSRPGGPDSRRNVARRARGVSVVVTGRGLARSGVLGVGLLVGLGGAVFGGGCTKSDVPPSTSLGREELLDPETCRGCHADHYREWSGSMHAYAADDPVFVAMNQRGQRETRGALGDFCVKCHAPMAVRAGLTRDGLNLGDVPRKYKGVTCFFCHTVDGVLGTHNNPLRLSDEPIMAGGLKDPVPSPAHKTRYSVFHDRERSESAQLCGTCHDIVTPAGASLERTFTEWQASVFAREGGATCGQCHMEQSSEVRPIASIAGAPARRFHAHDFPAVDLALTPFPEADHQRRRVDELLEKTLKTALCVTDQGGIRVLLDNVAAGHGFPSGSSLDRRLWTEVVATKGDKVIYESGRAPIDVEGVRGNDPDLWLMRDCVYNASGKRVSMFWEAATHLSNALPAPVTLDPRDPRFYQTHIVQKFPREGARGLTELPDRVTLRVRLQPVGRDVLDELVQSGDLASKFAEAMPILEVGAAALEWTPSSVTASYVEDGRSRVSCVTTTQFNFAGDKTPAPESHARCPASGGTPKPTESEKTPVPGEISCGKDPKADSYRVPLEKAGRSGKLRFVLSEGKPAPPSRGSNLWKVRILSDSGTPVAGATVNAKLFMPAHGHGSFVDPKVEERGAGDYVLSPIEFFMPGLWEVTVEAATPVGTDVATFAFCIPG